MNMLSKRQRKAATATFCRAPDRPNELNTSRLLCATCGNDVRYTRDSAANYVAQCCGREISHYSLPGLAKAWNQTNHNIHIQQCIPNGGVYGFTQKGVELFLRKCHIQRADIIQTGPCKMTIVIGHKSKGRLHESDFVKFAPHYVEITVAIADGRWLKGRKKYTYKQFTMV